ncbi:MAG: hypothetical protein LBH04_02005 [Tannerellaceae bacterium]|jgi:hypothetical protein|nr:hypothetical protein [Tannerellaceae bacterium]
MTATNQFSLRRISLILRADWLENRRTWLYTAAALLIGWVLLQWGSFGIYSSSKVDNLFGLFGLIMLINYCRHVGRKLHRTKGNFLALPASNVEKYAAIILEGALFYLALLLFYGLAHLIVGLLLQAWVRPLPTVVGGATFGSVVTALFFSVLMLLSYVSFPKRPLLIYVGAIGIYTIINVCIMLHIGWESFSISFVTINSNPTGVTDSHDLAGINSTLFDAANRIMDASFAYVLAAATLALMYIIYIKVKELEHR